MKFQGRGRPMARAHRGRDWFSMRMSLSSPASAEIYIYDEIGYWGTSAERFVLMLAELNVDNIDLHINSPGGDVYDGIAIYQGLRSHRANVKVYVDSLAASAASFIAMAGDEVIMGEFADMMIHDGWGLCVGNAADMREMADRLDSLSNKIAAIYASRAGGEVADWRSAMTAESWYDAQAAVDAGLADSVMPSRERSDEAPAEMAEAQNSWDIGAMFKHAPEKWKNRKQDDLIPPKAHAKVGLGVIEVPDLAKQEPDLVPTQPPENPIPDMPQNAVDSGDLQENVPVIQSDTAPEESDSEGQETAEAAVDDIDTDSFLEALRGAFDDD